MAFALSPPSQQSGMTIHVTVLRGGVQSKLSPWKLIVPVPLLGYLGYTHPDVFLAPQSYSPVYLASEKLYSSFLFGSPPI